MNIETILKRLWPLLRPRVIALLATQLKALATKSRLQLTDDDAVGLAAMIVALITELLDKGDNAPLVAKAVAFVEAND